MVSRLFTTVPAGARVHSPPGLRPAFCGEAVARATHLLQMIFDTPHVCQRGRSPPAAAGGAAAAAAAAASLPPPGQLSSTRAEADSLSLHWLADRLRVMYEMGGQLYWSAGACPDRASSLH